MTYYNYYNILYYIIRCYTVNTLHYSILYDIIIWSRGAGGYSRTVRRRAAPRSGGRPRNTNNNNNNDNNIVIVNITLLFKDNNERKLKRQT